MKVLVIGGSGGAGREHALCWKLSQSKHVDKIFCAPGNSGTSQVAQNVDINELDVQAIANFAEKEKIDLTFVGPEGPLVAGITDELKKRGLRAFGPSKAAAMLEGSKSFAKEVMSSAKVPTARYKVITNMEEGDAAISEFEKAAVKADGLAGGKGVVICNSKAEIKDAVKMLLESSFQGSHVDKIVIEELLEGQEASMLAFCDGKNAKLMLSSQDHKRIFDDDKGSNTGGMGAYAPTPVTFGLDEQIHEKVFVPVLREMEKRGTPYVGVLYAGLMIKDGKFNVLEFNARFGDPEAQPLLSLLKSDLVEVATACLDGQLENIDVKWKIGAACTVVVSSKGYPGKYEIGKVVTGLEEADRMGDLKVFHAGSKLEGGKVVTNGGRVFGVTATGLSIKEAIDRAYLGVSLIKFDGMHYRRDIGKAALQKR